MEGHYLYIYTNTALVDCNQSLPDSQRDRQIRNYVSMTRLAWFCVFSGTSIGQIIIQKENLCTSEKGDKCQFPFTYEVRLSIFSIIPRPGQMHQPQNSECLM